jgi:hypothetical protein
VNGRGSSSIVRQPYASVSHNSQRDQNVVAAHRHCGFLADYGFLSSQKTFTGSAVIHFKGKLRAGMTALGNSGCHPFFVNSIVQHGRIVEIEGTTDPGSIVDQWTARSLSSIEMNSVIVGPLPQAQALSPSLPRTIRAA